MLVSVDVFLKGTSADDDFFYTLDGRLLTFGGELPSDITHVQQHARLRGGKGGFGSMLRAIGNQIEKTTNREMCRDLSGRRMRDVNAEQKLKEWYSKANEREKAKVEKYLERQRRRRETLERGPLHDHKFDDPEYHRRKESISSELQDAVSAAIQQIVDEVKTNPCEPGPSNLKRSRLWIERVDGDDSLSGGESSSDYSSSASNADCENSPGLSSLYPETDETTANSGSQKLQVLTSQSDSAAHPLSIQDAAISDMSNKGPQLETNEVGNVESIVQIPLVPGICELELTETQSAIDLEARGLQCLKQSLLERGLKCGGTLKERAHRLFAVRGLSSDQYPEKLRAKTTTKN